MNGLIAGALGRPVAVGAACAAVALLALAVGARLPVALLPPIAAPKLYVWTAAPAGGTPAATEETVTVPVERAVADAAGLARLESWSRAEGSLVRLTFSWRTRLDGAAVEVRQLLGQATLPGGAVPVLLPDDPERRPLLLLAVEAPGGETAEGLRATQRLAESLLVPRLERVEGVGRVALVGGAHPRVRVLADETRLRQAGLAFADVERALAAANVSVPGGRLRRGAEVYAVELSGGVTSAEAIRRLPLGPSRRLGDVARVEDVLEPAGRAYAAGRPALLVAASARADANALRVADALRAEVAAAEADLRAAPGAPALAVRVLADESAEVRAAVSGIGRALAWGGVLVALVLVLTLRVGGLVLPVLVALPLSLAGAVALFAVAGLGLNLLTLAGLALAIGMLVDNALVVTEAVARQREEGRGPDEAALRGTREVAGPIVAGTLTTVAVFVPIAFVDGLAGRLFQDQALAAALALGASLVVALTVVPVLARRSLRRLAPGQGGGGGARLEAETGQTEAVRAVGPDLLARAFVAYERALRATLRRPARALVPCAFLLVAGALAALALPRELLPAAGAPRTEAVLGLPPAATPAARERLAADIAARLAAAEATAPDVPAPEASDAVFLVTGGPEAAPLGLGLLGENDVFVSLPPRAAAPLAALAEAHGATLTARPARTAVARLLGQDEADLDVDVHAERIRRDASAAAVLADALAAEPALANVGAEALARLPAYAVEVDARAAARYGVARAEVVAALEAAAGGREATALASTSENVPVRVALADAPSLARVLEGRVPRAAGPPVPLRLLVRATEAPVPAVLVRADLQPVFRLSADLAPGASLPAAETAVRRALGPHLRAGEDVRVRGLAEAFRESVRQAGWALVLSLGLVYLLLAAQFESLRLPLVVLTVVPLSLGGVALTLAATGHTLNVMSLTGAVVLTGIVVNDAILKVSFAERERAAGRAVHAAIRAAGRARFRPILMTTATTVLGLLPVAWQRGDAAVQAPLAVAVIGGLLVATVLALLVVPVLYAALAPRSRRPVQPAFAAESRPASLHGMGDAKG